jgi:hypothetical protein
MVEDKKFRLIKVLLNEISLVDDPAEPNSLINFYKKHGAVPGTQEGAMSDQDHAAALAEATATITKLTKAANDAVAAAEAAVAKIAKAEADTAAALAAKAEAEAKLAKGTGGTDDEDPILKAAGPVVAAEIIRLRNESKATAKLMVEMQDREAIAALEKKLGTELSHLPTTAAKLAPIFKALSALPEEQSAELTRLLKAGDAALGSITRMTGYNGHEPNSAEAELEALAKSHQATAKVSFDKAYAEILKLNPDIYRRYLEERGEVNRH